MAAGNAYAFLRGTPPTGSSASPGPGLLANLAGRSPDEIRAAILDAFAPAPGPPDAEFARLALDQAMDAALSQGDIPPGGMTEDQAAAFAETFAAEHIYLAMMALRGPTLEGLRPHERYRLESGMAAIAKDCAEQVVGEARAANGGALPCDVGFLRTVEERALSLMEHLL